MTHIDTIQYLLSHWPLTLVILSLTRYSMRNSVTMHPKIVRHLNFDIRTDEHFPTFFLFYFFCCCHVLITFIWYTSRKEASNGRDCRFWMNLSLVANLPSYNVGNQRVTRTVQSACPTSDRVQNIFPRLMRTLVVYLFCMLCLQVHSVLSPVQFSPGQSFYFYWLLVVTTSSVSKCLSIKIVSIATYKHTDIIII